MAIGVSLLALGCWIHPPPARVAAAEHGREGRLRTTMPARAPRRPDVAATPSQTPSDAGKRASRASYPENLSLAFQSLAAAADAGDKASACVLARGLDRCRQAELAAQDAADRIDQAARLTDGSGEADDLVETIGRLENRALGDASFCRGLSGEQLAQSGRRLYQAAVLGDPVAMVRFATDAAPSRLMRVRDPDYDRLYRTHALEMLERSASMGDLAALQALYRANASGMLPNGAEFNGGNTDETAAAAIGAALMQALGKDERAMIAVSFDRVRTSRTMDSDRYRRLLRRYTGHAGTSLRRGKGMAEHADQAGCPAWPDTVLEPAHAGEGNGKEDRKHV
jgi:hypothetical protein